MIIALESNPEDEERLMAQAQTRGLSVEAYELSVVQKAQLPARAEPARTPRRPVPSGSRG